MLFDDVKPTIGGSPNPEYHRRYWDSRLRQARRSNVVLCECGRTIQRASLRRHRATKVHLNGIEERSKSD